jgi:surface carbohydrate biosynthesis protein (TIGR04326 family)
LSGNGGIERIELSEEGIRDSRVADRYDSICTEYRREFVELVAALSAYNTENIDWWVSAPASRNEVLSRLFRDFTYLRLVQALTRSGELPDELAVESSGLKSVLGRLLDHGGEGQQRCRVVYSESASARLVKRLRRSLSPWRSVGRILVEWLAIRAAAPRPLEFLRDDRARVLIDTFALSDDPSADRYYTGLEGFLDANTRQRVWFAPQFMDLGIPALVRAARNFSRSERRFVLKETLLGLKDIAWCCGYLFRRRSIDLSGARFKGLDLTQIVAADLNESAGFRCALRGLLNYRFIRNLSRRGLRLSRSIDWFENHPMDRGWNAAVNQYYGSDIAFGYQGFFPALPAARPTEAEYDAGVVPHEIIMMGAAFEADTREFCQDIRVTTGPAFRYASLRQAHNEKSDVDDKAVLVALPYYDDAVTQMCTVVADVSGRMTNYRFYVKPHPAASMAIPEKLLARFSNVEFVAEPLHKYFPRVSAVVCGGESTASLEAMACGKPVLLVGERGALHRVTMPEAASSHLWRACADSDQARQALHKFFNTAGTNSPLATSAANLRDSFFAPVNSEIVCSFLGIRGEP